ncbi:MAG: hypothetical protein ACD_62C00601G0003 [uncultured bacterium]|nr:MAG: hypothetical protein ACD_62C00601G0003 [uncultured bacterium]
MTNSLNQDDLELITEESDRYQATHEAIVCEAQKKGRQYEENEALARELTSQIVTTHRDEDKQALQSDESVAHGLTKLRLEQNRSLKLLLEQPYFARVVYCESDKSTEFKLGLASFPEQRIIDWRKAPLSKLYYDYEEGQSFDTEIAGRERQGSIELRRAYQGKRNTLSQIDLNDRSYVLSRGQWSRYQRIKAGTFSLKDKEKIRELLKNQDRLATAQPTEETGYLGQILSLLSPEQFCLISTETHKPVIIQGSAGTGKTTVALHRLAWLLYEGNSAARPEQSIVLVYNKSLAAFVGHVLPELGVDKVKVATYHDWALDIVNTTQNLTLNHPVTDVPEEIVAHKTGLGLVDEIVAFCVSSKNSESAVDVLMAYYGCVLERHQKREIDLGSPLVHYLSEQVLKQRLDVCDLALLLHIIHVRNQAYRATKHPTSLDYLVVDEAQDFSPGELKTIFYALSDMNNLTMAGDLGQKILSQNRAGDWETLLSQSGLTGIDVLNLRVAYRSTYQIYEMAEFIRDPGLSDEELKLKPKFGPEPVLTKCHAFLDAIDCVANWLDSVLVENRATIGAIICKTGVEARQVYDALIKQGVRGIRLGDMTHFEFTPGITITDIRQVKGLEFSTVMLFNPSQKNYSIHSMLDRNLLYVAVTRASFRLDMVCHDTPSDLIPHFIYVNDLTAIAENFDDKPLFSNVDQDVGEEEQTGDDARDED